MPATIVLIRGIPGSGKSTLAKTMKGYVHVEADMYFINNDGEYQFDREKLKEAHEWCARFTESCVIDGYDVVVSNTFTRKWEMYAYFDIAERHGATVHVVTCNGSFDNVHGVPKEAVERMKARFEH